MMRKLPNSLYLGHASYLCSTVTTFSSFHLVAGICDEKKTPLLGLMESIGGPVMKMAPESILLIARAGSYLYHLDTPTSDIDYVIIYAEPTEVCGINH